VPFVYKGKLLKWAFDDRYADEDGRDARYQEAIDLLENDDAALELLTRDWGGEPITDDDATHFRQHWLEPAEGDLDAYMRKAFIETIQHAKDRGVALEAVFFYSSDPKLEIAYVDNPNSVLVVIKRMIILSKQPAEPWSKVIQPEEGEINLEQPG
jgi:hypothetical protein